MHTLSSSCVVRSGPMINRFFSCPARITVPSLCRIVQNNRRAAVVAPRNVTPGPEMQTGKDEEGEKRLRESLLQRNVKLMNDLPQEPNKWWVQLAYLLDPIIVMATFACIGLWTFLTFKSGNVQDYVAFSGCLATIASLVKLAGNAYKTIKTQVAEVATEVELRLTVQLEKEGAAIRKELSETEARILAAIAGSKP